MGERGGRRGGRGLAGVPSHPRISISANRSKRRVAYRGGSSSTRVSTTSSRIGKYARKSAIIQRVATVRKKISLEIEGEMEKDAEEEEARRIESNVEARRTLDEDRFNTSRWRFLTAEAADDGSASRPVTATTVSSSSSSFAREAQANRMLLLRPGSSSGSINSIGSFSRPASRASSRPSTRTGLGGDTHEGSGGFEALEWQAWRFNRAENKLSLPILPGAWWANTAKMGKHEIQEKLGEPKRWGRGRGRVHK